MNRIDRLITELCPNGVEYRALGEVGKIIRGKRFVKDDMGDEGVPCIHYGEIYTKYGISAEESISFVTQQRARTLRFANPGDVIMASAGETIEDIGKSVAWLGTEPIAIHDACYAFSSSMDPVFVAHFFASYNFRAQIRQKISSSKISSISTQNVAKARIPVPPLEIQREIANILDIFGQLEAELEAELEARSQQYAHYLDTLFNQFALDTWVPLSDVGEFSRGSSVQKKHLISEGVPCFHYGQVYTHYGISARETLSFVTEDFAKNKRTLNPGDVFVATTSENEEDLGKAVAWMGDRPAVASNDAYIFRPAADARYISYFFSSSHFQKQKQRFITGTKVKRISDRGLKQIRIPLPSLEDQKAISDQLDKFDTLVNDISIGLPAEITARRQQYEYYRDKLLIFKELEGSA